MEIIIMSLILVLAIMFSTGYASYKIGYKTGFSDCMTETVQIICEFENKERE